VPLDVLVPPAQGLRVVTSDVLEVHQARGVARPGSAPVPDCCDPTG
jgi:hypothetical protein